MMWRHATAVAHSAFATALVFIVMQFVAFTLYFNKTYVGSLEKAMAVPTASVAFKLASGKAPPSDVDGTLAMCGQEPTATARKQAEAEARRYVEEEVPRTDEATPPHAVGGTLLLLCPVIFAVVYRMRRGDSAQAMFNGALICSIFTVGEIVGWLLVNVPIVQKALDKALHRGLEGTLRGNQRLCNVLGVLGLAQARGGGTSSSSTKAYEEARLHDGTNKAARRRLWIPAAAVVFGCLAAAGVLLAAGRAKATFRDCGREVILTTALVAVVQWYFIAYTMTYKFYGSEPEGMSAIMTAGLCRAVGGPGVPPLSSMPPSLATAAAATDAEIQGSSTLRIIFWAYLVAFVALSAKRVLDVGAWAALTSTARGVGVAGAGWLTEAYFYQFVVAETTFVTWPEIEGGLLAAGRKVCANTRSSMVTESAVSVLLAETPARMT